MSQYSVVLWDVGGVLLTNGWDHNGRKAVYTSLGITDQDEVEKRHAVIDDTWERGTVTFDDYLKESLFYRERPFTIAAAKQQIEALSVRLGDSALPILEELHGRGEVVMGQLNNESRELNDMRLERFGLKQYLSVFFCSAYVGLRKPEPAFYRLAQEVLQKPPSEIVFIDDREKNAQTARDLGMHGIQYIGSAALRAELKTLGLL